MQQNKYNIVSHVHIVRGNDVIHEYDIALFPLEKTNFSGKY